MNVYFSKKLFSGLEEENLFLRIGGWLGYLHSPGPGMETGASRAPCSLISEVFLLPAWGRAVTETQAALPILDQLHALLGRPPAPGPGKAPRELRADPAEVPARALQTRSSLPHLPAGPCYFQEPGSQALTTSTAHCLFLPENTLSTLSRE